MRNLKKQNKMLKSENDTLLDAWIKTQSFLEEVTDGVPLEELLQYRKLPKKAIRVEQDTKKVEEDVKEKWLKWRKENL